MKKCMTISEKALKDGGCNGRVLHSQTIVSLSLPSSLSQQGFSINAMQIIIIFMAELLCLAKTTSTRL